MPENGDDETVADILEARRGALDPGSPSAASWVRHGEASSEKPGNEKRVTEPSTSWTDAGDKK